MAPRTLLLGLAAAPVGLAKWGTSIRCPGSASFIHASCKLEATAAAGCEDVVDEIKSRVDGQNTVWNDPHNNGTYAILDQSNGYMLLSRTSGAASKGGIKYTDKVLMTFSDTDGGCAITGCSESQSTSVFDFSTNYCNIHDLYCGEAEGCPTVKHSFAVEEKNIKPSSGAGTKAEECKGKKQAARMLTVLP